MQHVPQQQRLTRAALVCRAWAPAAAQATVHVERELQPDSKAAAAMGRWLAVYAGQVLSLKLTWPRGQADRPHAKLQLPLDKLGKLQTLQMEGFDLQLPGEGDSPPATTSPGTGSKGSSSDGSSDGSSHAAQPVLASLQHMELSRCQLANVSSLMQITQAPQLSTLRLEFIFISEIRFSSSRCLSLPASGLQEAGDAVAGMLQQLPQLSVLQLPGFPFTDAAVQQAAALTRLQQVEIEQVRNMPVADLQQLPSSIAKLTVFGGTRGSAAEFTSPSLPPQLSQLTGLLHLELSGCAVPTMVLGSVTTQLELLELIDCGLLPVDPDPDADFAAEGAAALLGVLPRFTRLKMLRLFVDGLNSTAPQRFSALTASSHLTQLAFAHENEQPLPQGAVQHMFTANRQLKALQHFQINTLYGEPDGWCLDSADVIRIASCCPQLKELDLGCGFKPDADVSSLLQLPSSCTKLHVGGEASTDAATAVFLQLTQIRGLGISWCEGLTDAGLEQLTRLDLQELLVYSCSGVSQQVCPEDMLDLKPDPDLGSVSQQLEALCDNSPVLAPARLQRHKELLAAAAAREEELCERLKCTQAEVEHLKQQLEKAQAGQ